MLPAFRYTLASFNCPSVVQYESSLPAAGIPSDPTHTRLLQVNLGKLLRQAWELPTLPPPFLKSFQWAKRSDQPAQPWTSHWLLTAQHPSQQGVVAPLNCQLLVTNNRLTQHPVLLSAEVPESPDLRTNFQSLLAIRRFYKAASQWVRSLHALQELVKHHQEGIPPLGEVQALLRHPSHALLQPVPLPVVPPSSTPNLPVQLPSSALALQLRA